MEYAFYLPDPYWGDLYAAAEARRVPGVLTPKNFGGGTGLPIGLKQVRCAGGGGPMR